ncbi:MAG: preprotein translocase subunit YajC [Clostridium sp.]|nr:preprotein translocase subunit YajC [Clostridium sp.]MCM1398121.1 preprotein translocase subunit YajC [Clostridium sp.]MCM1460877.1 preprotein translocase subunit YajC [Bacteroides sp.]
MLLEAAATDTGAGGSIVSFVLIIVVWVLVFYFMLIKPQKKQKKAMEDLHNAMEPGDNIMTTGGFYGTILDIVDDTTVIVEFGNNKNCRIPMHKNAIAEVEKAGSAEIKDEEN